MNRFTLLIGFLMMSASCGNDTNVSAINSGSFEQALGDAWGNKTPSGQEVRSDDKLSSNTKGKQRRNTLFVNNGEVVELEHKRLTAEVPEVVEDTETVEETATETETVPSGSGGGGTSEETPVFDCAGMQGCVCREDGSCNDGLLCNYYSVCEPEACDMVECALRNNACNIFYCSPGNVYCQNHMRDDDHDGAASCGTWEDERNYPGGYDCNDYDRQVHPGVEDVCGDNLDNDCNDVVDDGCYEEEPECNEEEHLCNAPEHCGLPDYEQACVVELEGVPTQGVLKCGATYDVACRQFCEHDCQSIELCDGIDNDCDGAVDEDYLETLGLLCVVFNSDGLCINPGEVVCNTPGETYQLTCSTADTGDHWTIPAGGDFCSNTVDDDCNGVVNDGCEEPPVEHGWYECEVSPDTPHANIILAGTTAYMLVVRCKAHGEDVKLDTFSVSIIGNAAAVIQVDMYPIVDATVRTAAPVDGKASFSGVEITIPKEGWIKIIVNVMLVTLPTYPISSGDTVQLALGPNKGRGQDSGGAIYFTPSDPAPMGNEMVIRKTKPTISLASGSPSGAGIPGMSEVLRTYVCADSHGDVYLEQIVFELESTDIGSTTWNDCDARQLGSAVKWDLYDVDDPANKLDADTAWTFLEGDGTICEYGDNLKYAYLQLYDLYVPAGDCRTLVLRLDSGGANSANDNTLRVDIPDQTATAGLATPIDAINWCDDDLACGINGEFIRNLPLVGGTIIF